MCTTFVCGSANTITFYGWINQFVAVSLNLMLNPPHQNAAPCLLWRHRMWYRFVWTRRQSKQKQKEIALLHWASDTKTLLVSKSSKVMILVSQAPCGAMFASKCSLSSSPKFITSNSPPFPNPLPKFITRRPFHLTLAKAEANFDSSSPTKSSSSTSTSTTPNSPFANDQTVFVGGEDVPLEGVIQFEKPTSSSRLEKWG